MPHLPHELIDHIIGYLQDSVPDLLTCARVCKAWLEPSRARLFYGILYSNNSTCSDNNLYGIRIIQQSPHIAFHVRELELRATWLRKTITIRL
jgi:hypothetical protein